MLGRVTFERTGRQCNLTAQTMLCTICVQNNLTVQRWSYVRFMLGAVAAAGAEADADLVEEQVRVRFRVVSPEDPGGIVSASAPSGGITGGLQ